MEYEEMIEPRVNNIPFSQYGARMLDFSVDGVSYNNGHIFTPNAFFPAIVKGQIGTRHIKIELDFQGAGWVETEMAISDLVALFLNGCDLFLPDGFYYRCAFDKNNAATRPAPWISTVSFEFEGVRHGQYEQVTLTESDTIRIYGNRTTPVKLTVSGITETVSVMGITIAGLTGEVVIDGIARKVTQDGENVFDNTDITEFPTLDPGNNEVVFSEGLTVVVEYYPLYM